MKTRATDKSNSSKQKGAGLSMNQTGSKRQMSRSFVRMAGCSRERAVEIDSSVINVVSLVLIF